jgi:hypothetical protein
MSTELTNPVIAPNTEATVAEGNKALASFEKAMIAYSKAVGTFKQRTVATVIALRAEGYDDRVIATALRAVVEKHGVSRQHLNRVLTAPTAEGGAGMEAERKHEKSGSKGLKGKLAKDAAKGGVTVDLGDANSLFAALLTHFDGKAVKVMTLAEKLSELAQQTIERAAKAAK